MPVRDVPEEKLSPEVLAILKRLDRIAAALETIARRP